MNEPNSSLCFFGLTWNYSPEVEWTLMQIGTYISICLGCFKTVGLGDIQAGGKTMLHALSNLTPSVNTVAHYKLMVLTNSFWGSNVFVQIFQQTIATNKANEMNLKLCIHERLGKPAYLAV